MIRPLALLSLTLMTVPLMAAESDAFPPPRPAVECTPRKGLPNVFAKAAKGGPVSVAYLGGSITAQAGWRPKSLAWLKARYPTAVFTEINAAIGGTGSNLGVLRIDHDVLSSRPDLLFVEFAVNDAGAEPREIVRAMEGIVRKTWSALPDCDICFVYTFTDKLLPDLREGMFNRSAATMEVVADRYGIPSIHMGLEAVRLESAGKLLMKAPEAKVERVAGDELNVASPLAVGADGKIPFSRDGVHPYIDTGHRLYLEAIQRSIPVIGAVSTPAGAHSLPEPLDAKNYQQSRMLDLGQVKHAGPWTQLPSDTGLGKSYKDRVDSLWKAEPGATLSFRFKGTFASAYDLMAPDAGLISITVDGKESQARRFDGYCTYARLGMARIAGDLDADKVHEVTITVLDKPIDKPKILFEQNRADFEKNPQRYAGTNWYVGAIFIGGDLAP